MLQEAVEPGQRVRNAVDQERVTRMCLQLGEAIGVVWERVSVSRQERVTRPVHWFAACTGLARHRQDARSNTAGFSEPEQV